MFTATITSQGQITVPVGVRRQMGIKGGDKVYLTIEGDTIGFYKATDWDSLRGVLSRHKGNYPTQKQLAEAHVSGIRLEPKKDAQNTGRHQYPAAASY